MDAEPQYPVDSVTQNAMEASEPQAEGMNLDEAIADAVRERKSRGGRGGRGSGAGGERLKVRAVIVKRGAGPSGGGGGGGRGGHFGGRGGPAPIRKVRHAPPTIPPRARSVPSNSTRRGRMRSVPSRSRRLARPRILPRSDRPSLFSLTPLSPLSFSARARAQARRRHGGGAHLRQGRRPGGQHRGDSPRHAGRPRTQRVARGERGAKQVRVQGDQEPR